MKFGLIALLLLEAHVCWSKNWHPQDSLSPTSEKVSHLAYSLHYDHTHKNARWAAYELTPERLVNCAQRDGHRFVIDLKLQEASANPDDYRQTGFDRGHLVPAGDMKWSAEVMKQSFMTSNITPQSPAMNRGRWSMLETLVRAWAMESEQALIVTGPVLDEHLGKLPGSGVSVPNYHFKVILKKKNNRWSGIGFLMDQAPQASQLEAFVFPIREIEKITEINFFPHLSKTESREIEDTVDLNSWNFRARFEYRPCPKTSSQNSITN